MTSFMFLILKMNVIAALIICATVWIGHFTKGKYSSKWKYYMWLIVMVFLLIPVDFSGGSLLRIQIGQKEANSSASSSWRGKQNASNQAENKNEAGETSTTDAVLSGNLISTVVDEKSNAVNNAAEESAKSGQVLSKGISTITLSYGTLPLEKLLNAAGIIWLCGLLLFGFTRGMRYYFSLHKMERWSYPADNEEMQELYFRLCRKKHIKNPPRLLVWEGLTSPMLAGIRNPGLYVPEKAFTLEELEFIFSHELSHYMRHDLWYKMLMLIVTTIYWFNPALYLMQREAEKDIENLCDGKMAAHYTMKNRMKYGELLLKIAASQNHIPYMSVGFSDGKKVFKDRILYMKNLRCLKEKVFPAVLLGAILVGAQVFVGVSFDAVQAAVGDLVEFQPDRGAAGEYVNLIAENSSDSSYGAGRDKDSIAGRNQSASGNINADGSETLNSESTSKADYSEGIDTNDGSTSDSTSESGNSGTDSSDDSVTGSAETRGITLTDEQVTVWAKDGSWANYVYRATDGNWYDGSGRLYYENGGGEWTQAATGEQGSEDAPETPSENAQASLVVVDEEGLNYQTLYQNSAGEWENNASGAYSDNGDGTFTGPDGTLWYEN